jgi:putative ABC transport system substrate-binding protein
MRRREFMAGLGGAAAWPIAARAQQAAMPVVGFLELFGPAPPLLEAFRAGLAEQGFVEGRNLIIVYRWAGGNLQVLRELTSDLVRRQVSVIVTRDFAGAALAAKAATSTIPIVSLFGGDPVALGLVTSLNRPGGNLTGIVTLTSELLSKRLDLLLKLLPQAKKVGFLSGTRNYLAYQEQTTAMLDAGHTLGVEIMIVECRDDRDYAAALAKMVEGGADAMILGSFALPNIDKVVPLAALHKLPTIYPTRLLARSGGLMSYDAEPIDLIRRLGSYYAARILKGAKPSDLPVQQPTKFELVINAKTAKALGLTIPETLLATADQLIE